MSGYEQSLWHSHLQTPVIFNHHKPIEVDGSSINYVNLNNVSSTPLAVKNQERILIVTPLRDAAPYLSNYFELLSLLTYPHELIDLAFLVGDSTDDTLALLARELERVQGVAKTAFRSTMIVEKDFGAVAGQNVEDRHGFAAQGPRRKLMGKARNYLLSAALKPDHAWVYWRDVDIKESAASIIEDFVKHDRDVLVPSRLTFSVVESSWKLISRQTYGFIGLRRSKAKGRLISRADVSILRHSEDRGYANNLHS
jgi:hypothetical protein